LGSKTSHEPKATVNLQKLVDRTKLLLSSDIGKAWTLESIGAEIGVSPVYLTQASQKVKQLPLYQYILRLGLAKSLTLLESCDDLTDLGLELGFSSHSHFSAAFRKAYDRSPSEFQRSVRLR
jgi:AraC-like DNA-binding protein